MSLIEPLGFRVWPEPGEQPDQQPKTCHQHQSHPERLPGGKASRGDEIWSEDGQLQEAVVRIELNFSLS